MNDKNQYKNSILKAKYKKSKISLEIFFYMSYN